MGFHRSLRDSKSPQVSRTLLSILADLNNAFIWMVSTCPLISESTNLCTNPLTIIPGVPITIGITVTFMFFSSLAKSRYLISLFHFFKSGLVGRVFANGPGDLGSIPGCVIPKTFKMVLDTSLLNTQQYKVRIEGKVEQSRERSRALRYTSA